MESWGLHCQLFIAKKEPLFCAHCVSGLSLISYDCDEIVLRACPDVIFVGVKKIGTTMPRAGFEPTSLTFRASVLPLHHVGSLISPLFPCLPVYVALGFRGQCRLLHSSPWNRKSFNAYNYIHTGNAAMVLGSTAIQHVACAGSWSWHQCHGCDKNGKYCAQSGIRTQISGIPSMTPPYRLPDVTTIPTPTCMCGSLPQRSVQTTYMTMIIDWADDAA